MKRTLTSNLITVAVFSAASVLGGLIKIPSPAGSIALDSLPGYFSAAYFHPVVGGTVGFIGHIGSAATGGLPLGALHILIAIFMFLWCFLFGAIVRRFDSILGLVFASIVAFVGNTAIPVLCIPAGLPQETAFAITPFVALASAINIVLAALAIKALAAANIKGI